MIIVDKILEQREKDGAPIRVGMVGAGFMGRGIALQMCNVVPGMRLAAIANRHLDGARRAYSEAGVDDLQHVESVSQLERAIANDQFAVTEDAMLLCRAQNLDMIIEATGTVEFAAHVTLEAIEHKHHVVLLNAELDATLGPILKVYADRAGVILTNADGDQPAVIMNLYRFVKGIGARPVLLGNIKGLQDPYRTPTTQQAFARKWGQKPRNVTSYADGSKISFEQAIVANATGATAAKRGMYGPQVTPGTHIRDAAHEFPLDAMLDGPGIVDYVVGAEPAPGVFVLAAHDDPRQQHYLKLYKLGDGPLYCFYAPYHLCHFEVHNTVARAVFFADAACEPLGPPVCGVVAIAKRQIKSSEPLDGIGGYTCYGVIENYETIINENLLPMGLCEGAAVNKTIAKDQALTFDDVELSQDRLADRLWLQQQDYFLQTVRR